MKYSILLLLLVVAFIFPSKSFSQCAGMDIINQENFNSGTSGTWSAFDVVGDDSWEFSSNFQNAFINGFGGDAAGEEDWLISPALDFSTTTDIMLTFEYSERFSGPDMQVFYSTNYSGSGNPNAANWTLIETIPDLTSSSSFPSNVDYTIDLSALSFANIYIAFKYTATSPNGGDAESWRIDEVCISGGDPNNGGGGGNGCEPMMGDYYGCIEDFVAAGGNCAALKTQLFSLIDDHTVFPYTGNPFDVWDFMCQYDMRLNDAGTNMIMWDVYSDNPSGAEPYEYECSDRNMGTSNGMEGDTWNREHVFPQSWWGGGNPIQRSDVNNLLPSDTEVNSRKGSFQLGVVATPTFTSLNGTKVGAPANSCAATVFEPIDEYKGDMARMYFYIATRYEDQVAGWENNSSSSDDALSGDSYTVFEPCLLNLLLKWHKDDPVSQKELDRNEGVFMEQNNRNPYIDHPEYVDLVWGISDGTTITTPCQVLPVELLNFEAKANKDQIELYWTTASESDNSHFEIERSEDGKTFKSIARIEGQGTTLEQVDYTYKDQEVILGTSYYYRLKQVDFNGAFEYSETRIARLEVQKTGIELYPNPLGDAAKLQVTFHTTKLIKELFVMDIYSRTVLKLKQDLKNIGWNNISIDLQFLPAGTYFILDEEGNSMRFVKIEQ